MGAVELFEEDLALFLRHRAENPENRFFAAILAEGGVHQVAVLHDETARAAGRPDRQHAGAVLEVEELEEADQGHAGQVSTWRVMHEIENLGAQAHEIEWLAQHAQGVRHLGREPRGGVAGQGEQWNLRRVAQQLTRRDEAVHQRTAEVRDQKVDAPFREQLRRRLAVAHRDGLHVGGERRQALDDGRAQSSLGLDHDDGLPHSSGSLQTN